MTALQELQNILDNNRNWSADFVFGIIDKLLQKEKQQIVNAYMQGEEDGYHFLGSQSDYESAGRNEYLAETYFNETFNK